MVTALMLAGCGGLMGNSTDAAANAGDGNTAKAVAAEPAASKVKPAATNDAGRPAPSLAAYVGKYPFDTVNGHKFLDNPAVKAAIAAAVPDAKQRDFIYSNRGGINVPIFEKNGHIVAWGGPHRAQDSANWAVAITLDGRSAEVCLYEGVGLGDDTPSSQWFTAGEQSIMKLGQCPSSEEDYPPKEIAAG